MRRGWFGRAQAPAGLAVIQEQELGYTFDATFWGHGYATEAAQCVFAYARDVLRVAQRCSLRRDGQIDVLGRTLGVHVWPM